MGDQAAGEVVGLVGPVVVDVFGVVEMGVVVQGGELVPGQGVGCDGHPEGGVDTSSRPSNR